VSYIRSNAFSIRPSLQWDGDLNQIKARVKDSIEDMAARWSETEKQECVEATAAAFQGGGGVNSHLSGGQSPH
jgi:hypothetical protein